MAQTAIVPRVAKTLAETAALVPFGIPDRFRVTDNLAYDNLQTFPGTGISFAEHLVRAEPGTATLVWQQWQTRVVVKLAACRAGDDPYPKIETYIHEMRVVIRGTQAHIGAHIRHWRDRLQLGALGDRITTSGPENNRTVNIVFSREEAQNFLLIT